MQLSKIKMLEQSIDNTNRLFKVVDKLEQRIATLEKVIGKLQLRLGDVVLYIDKKEEQS
jgi:hypothetical protein